ncbi:MAG: shikimate kinase [Sulfobacillus thermosulfidooxidans]|nr:MAG: shikimate kinase [Sulfobacillus thermosulfidooxidans]
MYWPTPFWISLAAIVYQKLGNALSGGTHMDANTKRHLLLTGMMGSGKSTVGPGVAKALKWDFYDLDAEIERTAGKSVAEIFSQEGEGYFRRLEYECLESLLGSPRPSVISLGGGTLLDERSRVKVRDHWVVWLDLAPEELWRRVQKTQRPLAQKDFEAFRALYAARRPVYRETQTFYLRCDHLDPDQIVHRILPLVQEGAS